MQTFNYLIHRFMFSRQAIFSHLKSLRGDADTICVERLLPVWEMISEQIQRQAMQSEAPEPVVSIASGRDLCLDRRRAMHEGMKPRYRRRHASGFLPSVLITGAVLYAALCWVQHMAL